MKLNHHFLFTVALISAGISGCAAKPKPAPEPQVDRSAVFEELSVNSQPVGADVSFSSGQSCVTPCRIELRRDSVVNLTISKPGYKTESVEVINNLEALKRFNGRRGKPTEDIKVNVIRLVPNPVEVTLTKKGKR